jgi:Mg2+/Co2+ transporter CorB
MIIFTVLIVLSLIALASFISAIETAIVAASPGRIQKNRGVNRKVKLLLSLLKNKERVISTMLIIYSLVTTIATTFATGLIIEIVGEDYGTIVASAVMSVLIIVFAEVIPKAIAVSKAEKIALRFAKFIDFALNLMKPINYGLQFILKIFCFIMRIELKSEVTATDEVRGVIEHFHMEGNVIKNDRDMLGAVLDLRHITVEEIMVHRSQIVSINSDLPTEEIIEQALKTPYTRIPLWQDTKDNIIGILHMRSILKVLQKHKSDLAQINLKNFITEPWFVPENALLSRQLMEFKARRSHLAIVVDEYGDIIGILTLEDILEEIVGQMDDEVDTATSNIVAKDKTSYLVEGTTTIRDINRELNTEIPDADAHTISGVIMHELQRLPNVGDKLQIMNLNITIIKKQSHRIKQVLIEILPSEESKDAS